MDVVWKVYTAVVSFRLKRRVTLHNAMHAFRVERSAQTVTLEAKLAQK